MRQILQPIKRFVGKELHEWGWTRVLPWSHGIEPVAVEAPQDDTDALWVPVKHLGDVGDLLSSGGMPQHLAMAGPDAVLRA